MNKIFLPIMLLLFSASTFSARAGENKFNVSELRNTISKKISVPDNLRTPNFSGSVLVSFEIKEDGHIDVIAVNSANEELGIHVEQQLEKMLLKIKAQPGQVYNMKLNFRVLE
jgi:hypothetical protein